MQGLSDFLLPINLGELNDDAGYYDGQLAKHIQVFETEMPDVQSADIVLLGVIENRGAADRNSTTNAANEIRKHFYRLNYWHTDLNIADIGNVKTGASLADSYAAIQFELAQLIQQGKTVVIIGGSHDITLAQYNAYKQLSQNIEATCIDSKIDLSIEHPVPARNFLMEMLTAEPNHISHYNHLAFQSYYVHPRMLETIDKLGFDCYRAGRVQEHIEDMEPILRNTNMLSLDISAIKYSDAPANKNCPNGLTGVEACTLAQYAGMSTRLSSFGIYGYNPATDSDELTARQIAQIMWYFIDGKSRAANEAKLSDREAFYEYHTAFGEIETLFLQNKRSKRWWMQMPDKKFSPCTHSDFIKASNGDIPERWLRVQERSI